MTILTSWTQHTDERVDVLEITEDKIYIASYEGEDCSAVGCRHAEFVAGKLNSVAEEVFGKAVLEEALAWLRARH